MKKFLLLNELEVSQMIEDNSRISDRIDTEPADMENSTPPDGADSAETASPDNSSSGKYS